MRFNLLFIVLIFFFLSCRKESNLKQPKIIAHAGNGLDMANALFPDNTNDAIQYSLNQGADGVEVDVQLSKDGKLMLFHSAHLDGKTNLSNCIHSYSAAFLLQNAKYSYFKNQPIAELNAIDVKARFLFIDLRHYDFCSNTPIPFNQLIAPIQNYVKQHSQTKIIINSDYLNLLDTLKSLGFRTSYNAISKQDMKTVAATKKYPFYTIRNNKVNKDDVAFMQSNNFKIILFDIRSQKGNQNALKKEPDFIMTDQLSGALNL